MAGGMLTKQDVLLTAAFLNTVNDSVQGGNIFAIPTGVTANYSQTLPGDRIVLDDVTAYALSTAASAGYYATLYGGIYEYNGTITGSTASPGLGQPAFFRATDVGSIYQVTPDANPTAAIATFLKGVYINALSKAYWGWIQVGGIATVLYQGSLTATTAGDTVTVGISQTPPAFDAGVTGYTAIIGAAILGVAIDAPSNSGYGKVAITRSAFSRV